MNYSRMRVASPTICIEICPPWASIVRAVLEKWKEQLNSVTIVFTMAGHPKGHVQLRRFPDALFFSAAKHDDEQHNLLGSNPIPAGCIPDPSSPSWPVICCTSVHSYGSKQKQRKPAISCFYLHSVSYDFSPIISIELKFFIQFTFLFNSMNNNSQFRVMHYGLRFITRMHQLSLAG